MTIRVTLKIMDQEFHQTTEFDRVQDILLYNFAKYVILKQARKSM